LKYAVSAFAVARAGLRGWPQELRLTGWVLLTAGLGWTLSSIAASNGWERFSTAGLVFVVVTLAWAPLLASFLAKARSRRRADPS
jgi:hypothetical protein